MPPRPAPGRWSWLAGALSPRSSRPPIDIDLDRPVPAWALRAACIAMAVACTALVAAATAHWVLAAGLIAAMVVQPRTGAGAVFAIGVGLLVLTGDLQSFDVRVPLLVLGLHLTLELVTLTAEVPWRTTVERSVVRAHLAPVLPIQALSQPVAVLGPWLATTRAPAPWVVAIAGAVFAALAWATVGRLRTR